MSYLKLEAGTVRHSTDEVRKIDLGRDINCYGNKQSYFYVAPLGGKKTMPDHFHEPVKPNPGPWEPVQLIGHVILESDLMIAEFRREVAID